MSKAQTHTERPGDPRRHRINMISEAVVARYVHDLSVLGRRNRPAASFRVTRQEPAATATS